MTFVARIFPFLLSLLFTGASAISTAETLFSGGSELQLQWRGKFSPHEREKLKCWLTQAGVSAATLYGTLPRSPIRIVLERTDRARSPVPFAHVLREETQGIQFWVNPDFPLQRYIDDWTAVHEMAHLFIPYPGERDIWLSEGLATYYQNILQARSGVIPEARAWQKLYNGFMRGRADKRYRQLNLAQLSPRMRETRSFMRVYWAGTSYFLQADLLLRQNSQNTQTLDKVLRDFVDCCLHQKQYRSGRQLVGVFDKLAGSEVFSRLYQEYRQLYGPPDPLPLLAQLGISIRDEEVVLDEKPSVGVLIRRSMTGEGIAPAVGLPCHNRAEVKG